MGPSTVTCESTPAAPERVLLIPAGVVKTNQGRTFTLDEVAARAIIEAFQARKIDLVIDYDNQSLGGAYAPADGTAPAAGWVKLGSMQFVPGEGLYGAVSWTPRAAGMVIDREYRYLSPVVSLDSTGRVIALLSVGLTNSPSVDGAGVLVNSARQGSGEASAASASLEEMSALGLIRHTTDSIMQGKCTLTNGMKSIRGMAARVIERRGGQAGGGTAPVRVAATDHRGATTSVRLAGPPAAMPIAPVLAPAGQNTRQAIITSARAKFDANPELGRWGFERRTFVEGQLLAAGQQRLSASEAAGLEGQSAVVNGQAGGAGWAQLRSPGQGHNPADAEEVRARIREVVDAARKTWASEKSLQMSTSELAWVSQALDDKGFGRLTPALAKELGLE